MEVSNCQTDVSVKGNKITGTLKYLDSGAPAEYWGAGNFLCLKFKDLDPKVTSCKVGLDPSVSSGLQEIIGDPDMNGIFKVTDKDTQKFVVVQTAPGYKKTQVFDLSGLTIEDS